MSGEAVLVVMHFVVSIFGNTIGNPIYNYLPFPNQILCQQYGQQMQGIFSLDSEYTLAIKTQCVTKEEYDAWVQSQQPPTE